MMGSTPCSSCKNKLILENEKLMEMVAEKKRTRQALLVRKQFEIERCRKLQKEIQIRY